MRIFLDTADIDEIREAARWGILSGVTTNLALMMRSRGASHEPVIREIAESVDGPISAETVSLDTQGMLEEARRFDDISEDGMQVVRDIVEIYCKHNLPALEQAAKHPLTGQGIENALKDWETFMTETRESRQPSRVA